MALRSLIATALTLAVIAFVVYTVLEPVSVFGVSATGLEGSINRELESEAQEPADLECVEAGDRSEERTVWRCEGTRFGTEPVGARMLVDGDGCWRIRGGFAGEFGGRRGCINVWDAIGSPLF